EDLSQREHHLYVAAAQAAMARDDLDSGRALLKSAQKIRESAHFYAAAAELAAARRNHRGARERLKQALIAEPALAPHLLPGLIAAEQGLAAGSGEVVLMDDLADPPPEEPALDGAQPAPALEAGDGHHALPAAAEPAVVENVIGNETSVPDAQPAPLAA